MKLYKYFEKNNLKQIAQVVNKGNQIYLKGGKKWVNCQNFQILGKMLKNN